MPLILAIGLSLSFTSPALAQEASWLGELTSYIYAQQQAFHRSLADAIRALQDGGIAAAWGLVFISFMYGVFHAAGPGHGKALIGTYMLSHSSVLKKGITLSFAASFVQGLTAIALVFGATWVLGLSSRNAQSAVPILEWISFALIGVIGIVLMVRAIKAYVSYRRQAALSHGHPHGHDHHHDHEDGHSCTTCGHAHGPSPEQLSKVQSFRDAASLILSIGIRPCSGSVLVLVFANMVGLSLAGIAAVLAISLGTAITVSALALSAVYFRRGALYLARQQSSGLMTGLSLSAMFLGGLTLSALALSLLWQARLSSHPMF